MTDRSPARLLWTYPHLVARYQEVSLFLEAGFEVVCARDRLPDAEADAAYHDEMSVYYPRWRETLTLSSDVAERIRRFSPYDTFGYPDAEMRDLINRHIDVIYLGGTLRAVEGLGKWFDGTILYRVMGFPNGPAQTAVFRKLNAVVSAPGFRSRFVLSPGYEGLMPNRYGHLLAQTAVMNGWVERERTPYRWAAEKSAPHAVTAISYLHFHGYFQHQFARVGKAFRNYPLVVVGKNDRDRMRKPDPRIVGTLPFEDLYSRIAGARVFVDAGFYPNHLIWPPVEAAIMGVPVLFVRTSGLVDPFRAAGFSIGDLEQLGMHESFEAMDRWLVRHGNDIARLRDLAARQAEMFNHRTFGRARALDCLKVRFTPTDEANLNPGRFPEIAKVMARLRAEHRMHNEIATNIAPIQLDGGENRWLMPQQMRRVSGKVMVRNAGRPILVARPNEDQPGQLIETFLPPVEAGWYTLTVITELHAEAPPGEIVVEFGHWHEGQFVHERQVLNEGFPGIAEFEFELNVRPGQERLSRELRVGWEGRVGIGLCGVRLDTVPYPEWLTDEHRP